MVHVLCNAFLNLQCKMCFICAPKVIFSCSNMFQNKKNKKRKKEEKILQFFFLMATQKYVSIFYLTNSNKFNICLEIAAQTKH